jgi:GNAT superfamily N-acetyltransferase
MPEAADAAVFAPFIIESLADPRHAEATPFVASCWKQSYWRGSPWGQWLTWQVFKNGHGRVVEELLSRSQVNIALVNDGLEDDREYMGFVVWEPMALHFVYVKPDFRRMGIGQALVHSTSLPQDLADVRITHATYDWRTQLAKFDNTSRAQVRAGRSGLDRFYPKAVTDPYLWVLKEEKP